MRLRDLKRIERFHGHTAYRPALDETSIVVDLGANRGAFAREITSSIGCRCYAVEASPELAREIHEDDRVRVLSCAVAPAEGTLPFHIHTDDARSSLLAVAPDKLVREVQVPSVTLARLIEQCGNPGVDLIKMDIEGAEISVLEATPDDILRRVPQLSIEFHDFNGVISRNDARRAISRLTGLGFRYVKISLRGNEDTVFINCNLIRMPTAEYRYVKYAVRNVLGLNRILRRRLLTR